LEDLSAAPQSDLDDYNISDYAPRDEFAHDCKVLAQERQKRISAGENPHDDEIIASPKNTDSPSRADEVSQRSDERSDVEEDESYDNTSNQLLVIRRSSLRVKGVEGCLFTSLSSALDHILVTDRDAFSTRRIPSASPALRNLCNPQEVRRFICDRLASDLINKQDIFLDGQSARQFITQHYIDGGRSLLSINPEVTADRTISSLEDYVNTMRQATTLGYEVCIAVFIHCMKLSTTFLDVIQDDREGTGCILLDVCAVGSPHTDTPLLPVSQNAWAKSPALAGKLARQIRSVNATVSSRMTVIIVREGSRHNWAHAQSDLWNSEAETFPELEFLSPGLPQICEIFNPSASKWRPDVSVVQASIDAVSYRPDPLSSIIDQHADVRRRKAVISHLRSEHGLSQEEIQALLSLYERNGMRANMSSMPTFLRMIENIRASRDPLSRAADFEQAAHEIQGKWAARKPLLEYF
jgi:hypothetical protein